MGTETMEDMQSMMWDKVDKPLSYLPYVYGVEISNTSFLGQNGTKMHVQEKGKGTVRPYYPSADGGVLMGYTKVYPIFNPSPSSPIQ